MSDRASEIRKKIKDSGRDVRSIAKAANVSYSKLVRWVNGRTLILDVNDADRVEKVLTGRDSA